MSGKLADIARRTARIGSAADDEAATITNLEAGRQQAVAVLYATSEKLEHLEATGPVYTTATAKIALAEAIERFDHYWAHLERSHPQTPAEASKLAVEYETAEGNVGGNCRA